MTRQGFIQRYSKRLLRDKNIDPHAFFEFENKDDGMELWQWIDVLREGYEHMYPGHVRFFESLESADEATVRKELTGLAWIFT